MKNCENVKTDSLCDLDLLLSIDPSALIWIPVSEPPSENIAASSSYQRPSNNQTESNDSVARGSLSGLSPLLTQPPSPLSRGRWWSTSQVPRLTWKSIQWVGEPDLVMLMKYAEKQPALGKPNCLLQVRQVATTAMVASAMRGFTHSVKICDPMF